MKKNNEVFFDYKFDLEVKLVNKIINLLERIF